MRYNHKLVFSANQTDILALPISFGKYETENS